MRDKKDNATIDLPGFEPAEPIEATAVQLAEPKRGSARPRRTSLKQEQLVLLDLAQTDRPVWTRDPNLDLTGLPIWQPAE